MNVADKLDNRDYDNKLPYPSSPRQPLLARNATPAEIRAFADAKEKYEVDFAAFKELRSAYRAEDARLKAQLRTDLEVENNMVGHPKADKLWEKAWDLGHNLPNDVAEFYESLYELIG